MRAIRLLGMANIVTLFCFWAAHPEQARRNRRRFKASSRAGVARTSS